MAWDSSRACGEKKKERMRYHPGAIAINTGKSGRQWRLKIVKFFSHLFILGL